MDELLAGIRQAIKSERKAQEHYQELAEKSGDPKAKSMFEQMRRDEAEHEQILKARYEALKNIQDNQNHQDQQNHQNE